MCYNVANLRIPFLIASAPFMPAAIFLEGLAARLSFYPRDLSPVTLSPLLHSSAKAKRIPFLFIRCVLFVCLPGMAQDCFSISYDSALFTITGHAPRTTRPYPFIGTLTKNAGGGGLSLSRRLLNHDWLLPGIGRPRPGVRSRCAFARLALPVLDEVRPTTTRPEARRWRTFRASTGSNSHARSPRSLPAHSTGLRFAAASRGEFHPPGRATAFALSQNWRIFGVGRMLFVPWWN